jgi:hypothetical protein
LPIVLVLSLPPAALAQGVDVRLKDGSSLRGTVDRSTDASRLRIRDGRPEAYIISSIAWDEVAEIHDDDQSWPPDRFAEFRSYVAKRLATPDRYTSRDATESIVLPLAASSRPLWEPPSPSNTAASDRADDRVRFVEIDAVAANLDDTAPWDGLVLRIWPMNQRGEVLQVPATLSATLIGERGRRATRTVGPHDTAPERLAQWARLIRPTDFGPDGVSVRLPFQAAHPERWNAAWHPDQWIEPRGEVHVSLAIPGHGVFRASTATPIRLRRASSLRERQFSREGTRTFTPPEY